MAQAPGYKEGHLVVAAVRILEVREHHPPTIEEIAGVLRWHPEQVGLIARGLAEIARVGLRLGADPQTFYGLSGLGDLVLTCTGDLSRNRMVGMRVGKGERIDDILASMQMVAEGVMTASAAFDLSRRTNVAMPISEQVHLILHEGKDVRAAVTELLARDLRREKD